MGGGVSQPEAVRPVMKWSAKEGQIWVEYPEKNIQDALTEAFSKGREILTLQTMTGRELTIDIDMMVEIDLLTSKRRDLRCEYEGEFPPRRPAPNFDQDTLAEFEARVLSFLASRQLRFSDIFNEIDHDRNGWLTKLEVHLFFVHNVWSDTLPAVTTYIFEAMESGGQIGRVNYHSFSQASKQMKRVLDFEKQKKGIIMTKKLALKQSRAAVAASTKHDDSQKSDDLKERRSLDIATSDLSSPVEVFHIPEAMFGNTPDGKELGNEQKLSDRQDKPLSPNGLRIQIPLDYRTHKDLSPRSWIVSSWYWRSGEKASEARHLSALACARSHALLLLNTHRMHHHIEDVEKLKQQELHSAATAFAADVSSTNADLSDALTAALQEEANETARARDLVIQLKKAIDSDTLLLEDAIRARKDVDKSNAQLCSSSWEQVENYRCSIHKLERELVIAEERYMKRSNLTSCTSIAAQKVSEMTQALIETTRHMAQVRVEAELLRIAYRVAEKQHVVSFREAQKHEGVLLAHKAVLEAERAEVKALELFHKAEADVEAAVLALEQEDKIVETDYIDIPALRTKVSHLFDSIENKLEGGRNKGQEGYYTFSESSLGQTLFNARGTIAEEFRIHQHDIDPYQAHLSGDRPAWGALLTAIFNQWTKSPADVRAEAKSSLRYVQFDSEVRSLGYSALLREDWASLCKDDKKYRKACGAAAKRFKLSKQLKDDIGVDFFVSHNWCDENAPYRWTALVKISDLFRQRFGRLPRFWLDRFCIDQSKQDDIAAKTAFLPATIMSCNFVVVLQSPQYMGCTAPSALPSLWCIMEFFTLCTLAPADAPTANLLWVPLFRNANVPPKLDLLHGKVYCFSDEDKARLLSQLASCPGGLVEVQRAMAAVWPVHFRSAYAEWALLSQAAGDGDAARVEALLSNRVSVDLPFEWSPSSSLSTMVLVAAAILHEQWRAERLKNMKKGEDIRRWKPISAEDLGCWFVPALHCDMVRKVTTDQGDICTQVDINQPFGLLPPSWQAENEKQARAGLDVLREMPNEDIEKWAEYIHESWLSRRVEENNGVMPQWVVDSKQALPYAELNEEEKEKDRVVVRTVLYLKTDLGASSPELLDLGASLPRLARSPPSSSSSGALHEHSSEYSACQPLQAAVFRFLKNKKGRSDTRSPQVPPSGRKLRRVLSLEDVESCLDDKCIKMLVDAGADTLDAINQPVLGSDKLDEQVVFKLLEDLLYPLYKNPPHCISLTYNRLSTAGASRLLRFQKFINEQAKSGLSPPLISLCGLTPQAIRANWPANIDDDGEDLSESVEFNDIAITTPVSDVMVRFQAVNQPNLRAASFTLLLAELTSPPHINTITCLDLSNNASLATEVGRFAPLHSLKRINLERCPAVNGTLEPFVASCSKLTHIKLCGTNVEGVLPPLGTMLPHLRVLDLASTKVSGTLDGLVGASELQSLRFQRNHSLGGTLFPGLAKCSSLRNLDLSGTGISGTLQGANKLPRLETVVLDNCKNLTGSIVPLSDCPRLREMDVSFTALSGGPSLAMAFKRKCRVLQRVNALVCPRFVHDDQTDETCDNEFDQEVVDDAAGSRSPLLKEASRHWQRSRSIVFTKSQLNAMLRNLKVTVVYTD